MKAESIHHLLGELAACTGTPEQGVTRFSYSPEDRAARAIIQRELSLVGCEAWTDWAGNIHALLPGSEPGLRQVAIGSHLDSVRNGGRYDGAVGVVAALAVLRRLHDTGIQPKRGVRFIAFAEEEGSNFNMPLLGSKAFMGRLVPDDLSGVSDANGVDARELIASVAGSRPTLPDWYSREHIEYMLELHVEQGPSLDLDGTQIGVVDCIAADAVLTVTLGGVSGHSGATAMAGRRDALAGAAEMTVACEGIATSPEGEGAVATVGYMDIRPNGFNVIADAVTFTVDIRHPDPESLDRVTALIRARIDAVGARRGLTVTLAERRTAGVRLDPDVREAIRRAATGLGLTHRSAVSWAMHDAGAMAEEIKTGMIFIPSQNGLSHNPDEYTRPEAVEEGVNVLTRAVAGLAGGTYEGRHIHV